MKTEDYEVVVVGGGPAGSVAAIVLARAGRHVLLVEESHGTAFKIGESLPAAVRLPLQELDLWKRFMAHDGHMPSYGNLSAWGSPNLQSTDSIYDLNGCGWHLDRSRFDEFLRTEALVAGATVSVGARLNIKNCKLGAYSWSLSLTGNKSEQRLSSRWLVDATGRRSAIARARGERRHADDALVAYFSLFAPADHSKLTDEDSRTLIEAAPDGWWYSALLPSGQRLVAYLTDADLAPKNVRSKEGYSLLLSQAEHISACLVAHHHSKLIAVKAVPANSARLESYAGNGWIAVGDAAMSFDPISSQGIFNAVFTGMKAGEALAEHLSGNPDSISSYEKQLADIYDAYLQNRSEYYQLESRWSNRPFWRRRSSLPAMR